MRPSGIPPEAIGEDNFSLRVGCFAVFVLFFLLFLEIISPSPAFSRQNKVIIIRNDSVSLEQDLTVGRFGVGKLYFDDPVDLCIDDDNNVYILDSGNYRVQEMDEDGDFVRKWGKKGEGDGQFRDPVAIALDADNEFIYVLDRENFSVSKFDLKGNFILSFGKKGIRTGEFRDPVDLAVDFQGYVYVLDRNRGAVLKFHKGGTFVDEWGDMGRRKGEFADPVSIAFSADRLGFINVLDRRKKALLRFNRRGEYKETISLLPVFPEGGDPVRVRADRRDNLFILDGSRGKLVRLERLKYSIFSLVSDKMDMFKPGGFAIDDDDRIYVTDFTKDRVMRFILEPR
ncbi:MAG: 6-bladed beta-propeller [Deltaproteobacteria bacterium]|nr:6-bladed beta-propeller [Deltaproteobacteria bacterium]